MKIKISHPALRDFFDQLRFAPNEQKKKQLAAAEQLMMILDSDIAYPLDFVVFRITGYRTPVSAEQPLIGGKELIADLRVWVAHLSDEMQLNIADQPETIYTVTQLAERFSVSTKTIRRWQSRGLAGKIYVFNDGRKRKGFSEEAVDQFIAAHPKLILQAGKFTKLSDSQKTEILDLAKQLTAEKNYQTRNELILDIAERTGRVRETIRYVLADWEEDNPAQASLPISRGRMTSKETTQLYKLRTQGVPIKELMERFGRGRSSIYRIINQHRAKELFSRKIEYIDSDEFHKFDAEALILSAPLKDLVPAADADSVLLSRRQEMELFRRYNYLKFLASHERSHIQRGMPRTTRLNRIEKLLNQADQVKKIIIEANMPLAVSIAGKHITAGLVMSELVSEGSVSLMAAVEKFDYSRGYRFSTYAGWAIAKDFARMIPAEAKRPDRAGGADMANLPFDFRLEQLPDVIAVEQAQRNLKKIIENNLEPREQYVISNHYALDTGVIKKKPKTLKQIGDELNLSKERIRQIELQALQKLRQSLSPEQFDLLTG